MIFVEVLFNVPINQSFTYTVSETTKLPKIKGEKPFEIQAGLRCETYFGNRKMTGFIISVKEVRQEEIASLNLGVPLEKIKSLLRIIDSERVFTDELIDLSKKIARFYLCAHGEVLSAMIPSGRRASDGGMGFSTGFTEEASYAEKNLSQEQEKAIEDIFAGKENNTLLHYLFGHTGTGKTEVFLQLAKKTLAEGKSVIYLVPEIGLTHQVIEEIRERFGDSLAVLHSALSIAQKIAEWKKIIQGKAKIVVGARSAIFAPVENLGLIIIDEEHDASYKAGNTPRYHARQVAMMRSSRHQSLLVMGSATPSLEAWHAMSEKIIIQHKLTERLSGGKKPEMQVVNLSCTDMSCSSISPELEENMREVLKEERQVMLFLNRRGFTHFFKCNSCGKDLQCKNCSVALTYHKSEKRFRCHYCGWTMEAQNSCPSCNSLDIAYYGFGTEFIEKEVQAKFPGYSIERLDTDSLENQNDLAEKLERFRNGKTSILLGTQMVAKGLNFPGLKLVGVVLADTGLHMPDFRANERVFSLLVQVAGRAGRFFPDGKVIIQSFYPERPAIHFACNTDIEGFYKWEIEQRKNLFFPPFSRLISLVFRSTSKEKSAEAAESAYTILEAELEALKQKNAPKDEEYWDEILGPSPAPLAMIAQNHRHQILLRATELKYIHTAVERFLSHYKPISGVYIEVDLDPLNLL